MFTYGVFVNASAIAGEQFGIDVSGFYGNTLFQTEKGSQTFDAGIAGTLATNNMPFVENRGELRGIDLDFDVNFVIANARISELPTLGVVDIGFGLSLKFLVRNQGQPFSLFDLPNLDIVGIALGVGPGAGISIIPSSRGGASVINPQR